MVFYQILTIDQKKRSIDNRPKKVSVDFFPIFKFSRNIDESRDRVGEFLPNGLSAERNDFD